MRKGDARRDQIVLAAEKLFYEKGFEQTSVQDILDALHFSKGGFYHHFDSKLSLLDAICEMRADESLDAAKEAIERAGGDPVARLNALMDSGAVLRAEKLDYVALLLRVAYRDDGALMREKLKQRTLSMMLPLMDEIILDGEEKGTFFLPHARLAGELVLRLSTQFTDEVAAVLSRGGEETDQLAEIRAKLELYRHAVERMLSAPFGSVVLYDMENLAALCRGLSARQ